MKHYPLIDFMNCITDEGWKIIEAKRTPEDKERLRLKMAESMIACLEPKHKYSQPENN